MEERAKAAPTEGRPYKGQTMKKVEKGRNNLLESLFAAAADKGTAVFAFSGSVRKLQPANLLRASKTFLL